MIGGAARGDGAPGGGPTGRRYELLAPETGRLVREEPSAPDVGQVLVRVLANGVCASDLPTWSTRQPRYPMALGHEPVGEVVAVGSGVDLAVGIRVTGRIVSSYADFVLADARDVVVVPDAVPVVHALGEPLGCVVEAVRRTPIQLADRVAVIGLGFMGLCTVQLLAYAAGTARLTAIDLREEARLVAQRLGADDAYHPGDLPERLTNGGGSGHGFNVVVEATGTQAGLDLATSLVRPHGTISVLGFHQGTRQVDMRAWNWKAIDVVNAHVRDGDLLTRSIRAGLELLAAGRMDIGCLITHRYGLDQVDDAFRALASKPSGFIKAVIVAD
jgi:threonine dehydrogenase-like Zn-dependent dehydrogenase